MQRMRMARLSTCLLPAPVSPRQGCLAACCLAACAGHAPAVYDRPRYEAVRGFNAANDVTSLVDWRQPHLFTRYIAFFASAFATKPGSSAFPAGSDGRSCGHGDPWVSGSADQALRAAAAHLASAHMAWRQPNWQLCVVKMSACQ